MSTSSGAVVVAMARNAEKRVVETLRNHGAIQAGRAVPLALKRPGDRMALKRLIGNGSVNTTDDRFWLDERAYEEMREGRRVRAVIALIAVALIIAALIAYGLLGR